MQEPLQFTAVQKERPAVIQEGACNGEVTEYLGCKLVRNWKTGEITVKQTVYVEHVLAMGAWGLQTHENPVDTGQHLLF